MVKFKHLLLTSVLISSLLLTPINSVDAASNQTTFTYKSGVQTYTIPSDGNYKIEAWGASGGNYGTMKGGLGGKTTSTFSFKKGDIIQIYTGEVNSGTTGGVNGLGGTYSGKNSSASGAGGGASTVVRLNRGGTITLLEVAGGGGGANKDYKGLNGGSQGHAYVSTNNDGGSGGGQGSAGSGKQATVDNPFLYWNPPKNSNDSWVYPDPDYTYQADKMNANNWNIQQGRTGSYVNFNNINGFTEKFEDLYAYAQITTNGSVEVFSGYFNVNNCKSILYTTHMSVGEPDITWDKIDTKPNEYGIKLDESYIELIDQNGKVIEKFTARQIVNQEKGTYTAIGWNYPPIPPEEIQKIEGVCYYNKSYGVSKTCELPAGTTKVALRIKMVYNTSIGNSGYNSGIDIGSFYGSTQGKSASGGANYITTGFNATSTKSEIGLNSGAGKVVITNLHTHSYTSKITTQPTCVKTGVRTYTCSCGDSYTKVEPALGHKEPTTWKVTTEPTCTTKGVEKKICERVGCGVELASREIKALGHIWPEQDEWLYKANNNIANGLKYKECKRDNCSVILDSLYLNRVRYRYENVDGTFSVWKDGLNGYYKPGEKLSWSIKSTEGFEDVQGVAFITTSKAQRVDVTIYRKKTTLDIDGQYLTNKSETTQGLCTFDMYINGKLVADDVTEFKSSDINYGSTWYIKDIKIVDGKEYSGNDISN